VSVIQHYFPKQDIISQPEVTFLIPALNEEITIGEFVDWCHLGLKDSNISGQILIIDSSTDNTANIALTHGSEVLKVPRMGLGRAYIDALPYVRGKYIIMGDADLTYDVRDIKAFLECFHQGFEFVMGSRFKGTIAPGAMPALHRYFGTPLTTWLLNRVYRSRFSDIHCGLRGMTLDAFKKMNLQSQSWQYATEIVIKAIQLGLKTTEIPVTFYKDRQGRQSHHQRIGWYSPWLAGLLTVKTIFNLRKISEERASSPPTLSSIKSDGGEGDRRSKA
jgi:glycosyltransferase involved in cell wall biosynthesis